METPDLIFYVFFLCIAVQFYVIFIWQSKKTRLPLHIAHFAFFISGGTGIGISLSMIVNCEAPLCHLSESVKNDTILPIIIMSSSMTGLFNIWKYFHTEDEAQDQHFMSASGLGGVALGTVISLLIILN